MSISLPSREIYSVDVPEVTDFSAQFQYNYYVPDEGSSETGAVPESVLNRPADEIDADLIHYAIEKSPRFVMLNWSAPPALLSSLPNEMTTRILIFGRNTKKNLISDNIQNVVSEDYFARDNYVGILFNNGDLADKAYRFMSGTLQQLTLGEDYEADVSHSRASSKLQALLPTSIRGSTIKSSLNQPQKAFGGRFFTEKKKEITDKPFKNISEASISVQVNSKVLHDVVNNTISDPYVTTASNMQQLKTVAKSALSVSKRTSVMQVSESEFKTYVPYVTIKTNRSVQGAQQDPTIFVGYVIDKTEHLPDGKTVEHPSFIINSPVIKSTIDPRVKYGSTYSYTIRAIVSYTLSAIDDETDDVAQVTMLVSSKPSTRLYMKCVENVSPPPPSDVTFVWNYEIDQPMICWAFPPNHQRDVKKFQVFRRSSIDEPFELLREYDFSDALVRNAQTIHFRENTPAELISTSTSPTLFYFDSDFKKLSSKYIYAVCCIDAHGLTSEYSAQFEISFDVFQNKIVKRLVSHSGAPKPYPNMFLEADTFVDTIRVAGASARRLKVYFNPECYHVTDNNNKAIDVVATSQKGGMYKLQLLNLDSQQGRILDINIVDRTKPTHTLKKTVKRPLQQTRGDVIGVKRA